MAAVIAVVTAIGGGCGDDADGGPRPLVEDPAVVTGCMAEPPSEGTLAKRVECAGELVFDPDEPGILVAGRIGDLLLENSRVKVIVRGDGPGYMFPGSAAGTIVDAALHGRDDHIKEMIPLIELGQARNDEVVIVEAGDDGPAEIAVRGPAVAIPLLAAAVAMEPIDAIVETRYILEPDAVAVRIQTRLFRDGDGPAPTVRIGDLLFVGSGSSAFVPRIGIPSGVAGGEFTATHGPVSSYAVAYPADVEGVQLLDLVDVTGALGPARTVGNTDPVERALIIGDGSMASVAAEAWRRRGVAMGDVTGRTAPNVDILASDTLGKPFALGRSTAEGDFALALPVGVYTLVAQSPGRAPGEPRQVTVTAGGAASVELPAGASGTLRLTVRDSDGNPLPARAKLTLDGEFIHHVDASGQLSLPLPPGSYTLDVSRGVEYDAFTVDPLVIGDGDTIEVTATLNRVVDTSGWIAMDTHIHSEMSLDSSIPLVDRLRSIAAEGIEIAMSTDHDFVTDYAPVIAHLGLSGWLAFNPGVETSVLPYGHFNAWPLVPDYNRAAGGAFEWYDLAPDALFASMREVGEHLVIQLNHPRKNDSGGFFNVIDFDPDLGRATQDPAALGFPDADFNDFNFDAVEVANDFHPEEFAPSFEDWLSLVAHGHPAAATGSSDSHGASAFVGNSRTYVYVGEGNDDPAAIDLAAVDIALKERKAVVSQGAFVTAAIDDPATGQPTPLGELADLSGQSSATLRVKVQAPPWMPLARIRVFAGRTAVKTLVLDPADTTTVRFDQPLTIPLAGTDSFFVVLVEPAGPGTPVLGTPDGSFTNPLLFDVDGDGSWTPPGS